MDEFLLENVDVYLKKTLRYCFGCLHTENETKLFNLDTQSWVFTQFPNNVDYGEQVHDGHVCVWCARKLQNTRLLMQNMKQARKLLDRLAGDICTSHNQTADIITEINNLKYQTRPHMKKMHSDGLFSLRFDICEDVKDEIKKELECHSDERDIHDVFNPIEIEEENLSSKDFISGHLNKMPEPLLSVAVPVNVIKSSEFSPSKSRRKKCKSERNLAENKHKTKRKNNTWTEIDSYIKKEFITHEQRKYDMELRSRDPAFIRAPFACTECVLPFNYPDTYQNHISKHKLNALSLSCLKNARYICTKCGITRADRTSARRHYVELHASDRMVPCTMCSRTFVKESLLRTHILKVHSNRETKVGMFVCAQCGKCLKYKQSLRNHMMTHAKDRGEKNTMNKYLECSHCSKRFHAKGLLVKHLTKHSDARDFHCDVCKASFKSAPILTVHMQRKHSSPDTYKYECPHCQKRFLVRGELNYHVNGTHLKQGVPCTHCNKSFRNAFKMKKHVQIVHEKKPEPRNRLCEYCGKGFTEENRLQRHLLVHTGVRPYTCQICAAAFNQSSTLKGHIRRAHTAENYKEKPSKILIKNSNRTGLIKASIDPKIKFAVTQIREEQI